jgi:hypothetical protein
MVIAKLGCEGGGIDILGTVVDERWQFWCEGSSMALDKNDLEEWRTWASARTGDLHAIVPDDWQLMLPIEVNPDFVEWFRARYDEARARLSARPKSAHERWQEIFSGH